MEKWAEYFDGVLNRPTSISDKAINRPPQVECNPLLHEFPTVATTVKAIKPLIWQGSRIRYNTAEIYKTGGPLVAESYFKLCAEKKPSLKNSRMYQLSTYSNGKGILKSVTIIRSSLYYLFIISCSEDPCTSPTEAIE